MAGTREIVVHPNYIVFYEVTDVIEVLAVVHARENFPKP
jgi:plasmid stabilization system protein ParE